MMNYRIFEEIIELLESKKDDRKHGLLPIDLTDSEEVMHDVLCNAYPKGNFLIKRYLYHKFNNSVEFNLDGMKFNVSCINDLYYALEYLNDIDNLYVLTMYMKSLWYYENVENIEAYMDIYNKLDEIIDGDFPENVKVMANSVKQKIKEDFNRTGNKAED